MFNRQTHNEKSGLEKAIDTVLEEMTHHSSDSEEYKKMVDRLAQLYALQKMEQEHILRESESISQQNASAAETRLKEAESRLKDIEASEKLKNLDRRWNVSPDTMALVLGNLAGILIIVGHERAHVVTSKALQFLKSAR